MSRKWVAAGLSLVTIAGGHLYNRRPYTAILFLFLVIALQSLINSLVPLAAAQIEAPVGTQIMRRTALAQVAVVVVIAIASALQAFLDARTLHSKEGDDLKMVSSIAGGLIGLSIVVTALTTMVTILRFT